MTINQLQEELIEEIQELTAELSHVNIQKKHTKLKGYVQAIPVLPASMDFSIQDGMEETSNEQLFPYFIVRTDGVTYHNKEEEEKNRAHIMLVFAIYDDSPDMKGYYSLTSIIEKVIMRFQNNPVLGPFYCERNMEAAFQEDDTFPYFFGGIEMTWNLPEIEMEGMN